MSDRSRRAILGATGAALTTALAGCNDILGGGNGTPTGTPTDGGEGGGAEPGGTETEPGAGGTETEPGQTETQAGTETEQAATPGNQTPVGGAASIDEWLTETTVGGEASNYDGSFTDMTDQDSIGVDVGASGNGGNFAYSPAAVVVSPGTEVQWQWTGQGGPHNVEARPDEQLGASDYQFGSGDPLEGEDVTFVVTLDEPGVALYHCDEHLSRGMKGGVLVEDS